MDEDVKLGDVAGAEVAVDPEIAGLIAHFQRQEGLVSELIRGDSIGEVLASLEVARSAYERVAGDRGRGSGNGLQGSGGRGQVTAGRVQVSDLSLIPHPSSLRPVPAGGSVRRPTITDVSGLSAAAKIRRGLEEKEL